MCGSKRYRLTFSSLLYAQDIAFVHGYSFWREHMIERTCSWFAFPNAWSWNRSWNRNGYNCWDLLYEDLQAILNNKLHSIPELVKKRMAGRPRLSWTHETMKTAWNINPHNPSFDLETREMRLALQNMAQNRQYPFHWLFHVFFAAAATTGFTGTYVLEERIYARSVLPRGPCLRGNWRRLVRQEKRCTQLLDVRYPRWCGCVRRVSDPVDPESFFAFHLTQQMSIDEKSSLCSRHLLQ